MNDQVKARFWRMVLIPLFVISGLRLVGFAYEFSQDSLQMDFAAFYTAGESRLYGLSPYDNAMGHTPPVWDGFALLKHSRFLYPPLASRLFQPFAWLSYSVAKFLWTFFNLGCVVYALILVMRALWSKVPLVVALCLGIGLCWFHPVLTLLERGQVDGVTLLLIVLCVTFSQGDKYRQWGGGGFLALATLLKLHCVYLIPLLVLRKQWQVLLGFVGAGVVFVVLSLGLDGYALNRDYVMTHLPRIAQFGEGGTRDHMMPGSVVEPYVPDLKAGYAQKGGNRYRQTAFGFVASATLVDWVMPQQADGTHTSNPSWMSLGLYVVFCGPILFLFLRAGLSARTDGGVIWGAYFALMSLVLLVAPTSWVMNVVWLLPGLCLLFYGYGQLNRVEMVFPLVLCAFGLLLAGMPDAYSFYMLVPFVRDWLDYKYVLAEALCVLGGVLIVTRDFETTVMAKKSVKNKN